MTWIKSSRKLFVLFVLVIYESGLSSHDDIIEYFVSI